jgi:hypothetical protein
MQRKNKSLAGIAKVAREHFGSSRFAPDRKPRFAR